MNSSVTLSRPLLGLRKEQIHKLEFREPVYADYMELGDPSMVVETKDGAAFVQETPQIIAQYAQRLLLEVDPNLLDNLPLRDTLAIRRAVLDFFRDARSATPPSSDVSPESSSSASE